MPLPFLFAGIGAIISGAGAAAATVGAAAAGVAATAGTAAAVAGTAVAGAAAAVGTAAASTAVGGAVVGAASTVGAAATAVGTAVASTAVGGAAIGAMEVIGTGIGTAAAAASSAPVIGSAVGTIATIAQTSAGAAAVGTIATSAAVGTTNGISGATKLMEASKIKDDAVQCYENKRSDFDFTEKETNAALEMLGKHKLEAWKNLEGFVILWDRILNKPELTGSVTDERIQLTPDQFHSVKFMALSAKDLLKNGAVSLSGGTLVGFAAKTGASSLVSAASTGTAISSLSGAAATNATLAALGGGSLAAEGLGMAGGAAVLQGLSFAPAMAISGIMLNSQGKQSLEAAKDIQAESQKAIASMNEAIKKLKALKDIGEKVDAELRILQHIYNRRLRKVTLLVDRCQDYNQYIREEREQLHQLFLIVKLLKEITTQNLIEDDVIKKEAVIECINHSKTERRKMLSLQ